MMSNVREVLISREVLNKKVKELGAVISKDYKGEDLMLIGVLKGGFVFLADLIREITIDIDLDFMSVSSYGSSTKSSGVVRIIKDIETNIQDKHILLVEDIIDTGLTINYLKEMILARSPKSVKVCAMFDKPSKRKTHVDLDYKGIEIPDEFVIGYGLDYDGKYRNLPDLCIIDSSAVQK
jgi:hypoxanthine phosphoribosyltransferase